MFDIILNPSSAKGGSTLAFEKVKAVLDERGIEYTVHETDHPLHAKGITAELNKRDHTDLIVMGGDGTLNEVLNGITDFEKINIGIISCGTGNDFIRAAGIPSDPVEAINLILNNNIVYSDYLDLGHRRAINCTGAGMDVDVLVRYGKMKAFKGVAKYYVSLILTLIECKFHKIALEVNGERHEKSVFMIAAANGTCIGGGMKISPHSITDDGKLNVVLINEMPKYKILPTLIKFLNGGKHIESPYAEEYLADSVKIEVLDDGCTEVDGEVIENKVIDCRVVHNVLRIFK